MSLTMDKVRSSIADKSKGNYDIIVPSSELKMSDGGFSLDGEFLNPTLMFERQMALHLKIPFSYYNFLKSNHPDLLCDSVNTLNKKHNENRMIRLNSDGDSTTVRAYLSDRYLRIDNAPIIERVGNDFDGMDIVSFSITDDSFALKMAFPNELSVRGSKKLNDIVKVGVVLTNSETGFGKLNAESFLYRLVCLNGMVVGTSFGKASRKHLGSVVSLGGAKDNLDIEKTWRDFSPKLADLVDGANNNMIMNAVNKSTQVNVINPAIEDASDILIQSLSLKYGLLKSESMAVKEAFESWGDTSSWGLSSAFTFAAKSSKTPERRLELESIGGKVLFSFNQ